MFAFFFFKQKTAYEITHSDWSSDVCSSDLDDAIVVRENIVRHVAMGKDHVRAAREGTEEIGLAVMATTFAIVAGFVPIAFMSGVIGRFFFQLGMTVAVAVLVSLFI